MEDSVVVLSPTTLFNTPLNTDFKSCAPAFPAAAVITAARHKHFTNLFPFSFI
ncbi:hypothetical protein M080_7469, partial [Bacteroides fragilis str. 3397 T10]